LGESYTSIIRLYAQPKYALLARSFGSLTSLAASWYGPVAARMTAPLLSYCLPSQIIMMYLAGGFINDRFLQNEVRLSENIPRTDWWVSCLTTVWLPARRMRTGVAASEEYLTLTVFRTHPRNDWRMSRESIAPSKTCIS
jgi:hypothetical protein